MRSHLTLSILALIISSCSTQQIKAHQRISFESKWGIKLNNTVDKPVEITITDIDMSMDGSTDWHKVQKTISLAALESKLELFSLTDKATMDSNRLEPTKPGGSTVRFSAATLDAYTVCKVTPAIYSIRIETSACAQDEVKVESNGTAD